MYTNHVLQNIFLYITTVCANYYENYYPDIVASTVKRRQLIPLHEIRNNFADLERLHYRRTKDINDDILDRKFESLISDVLASDEGNHQIENQRYRSGHRDQLYKSDQQEVYPRWMTLGNEEGIGIGL